MNILLVTSRLFFFMSSSSYIDWRDSFWHLPLAFLLYTLTTSYPLESFLLSINEKTNDQVFLRRLTDGG
jgi:hypothetical protein